MRTEYVISDQTNVAWPGRLSYRDSGTRVGRGYRTRDEAEQRLREVEEHYNRIRGCSPGDLRIVACPVGGAR